jgi:hypothetical protein
MLFREKVQRFSNAIQNEASVLGLKLVNGPGTETWPWDALQQPSIVPTNGQENAVYLIAVADGKTANSDGNLR